MNILGKFKVLYQILELFFVYNKKLVIEPDEGRALLDNDKI